MDIWFTSDWHLGHAAIIEHCHRPFGSTEEMDETILDNFTDVVKRNDQVYYLGDLAMQFKYIDKYFKRFWGRWFYFRGNHDYGWWNKLLKTYDVLPKAWLLDWHDLKTYKFDGQRIVLSHFPLVSWDKSTHGAWHLHGHSHGLLPPTDKLRLDVGVDAWDYKPVHIDQIREAMAKKPAHHIDKELESGGED